MKHDNKRHRQHHDPPKQEPLAEKDSRVSKIEQPNASNAQTESQHRLAVNMLKTQVALVVIGAAAIIVYGVQARIAARAMVASSRAWIVFNDIGIGFDP